MSTYDHLWWDREFVEKRIHEQRAEEVRLVTRAKRVINNPQFMKLFTSAQQTRKRFERQLEEIQKLKGHCCRY